jgi:hypothetical protein
MQKIQQRNSLNDLMQIRQNGKYSSTNLIRGSMINEMFIIFSEYLKNNDLKILRDRVMVDNIIHKNSFHQRQNVWWIFGQRYLSCPSWVVEKIAESTKNGTQSQDFVSLAYLYYIFRERLAYDFVTEFVWPRWQNKSSSISKNDVYQFLVDKSKEVPAIDSWSETTLNGCSTFLLKSLKDFGILKGTVNKSIQRPSVALETAHHLLCILLAEGYEGKALVTAKDWRLFLWNEVDVIDAFNGMAMKQWIRFERSGPTTILELIHLPGERL